MRCTPVPETPLPIAADYLYNAGNRDTGFTGMVATSDMVFFFKRDGVYAMSGQDPSSFTIDTVSAVEVCPCSLLLSSGEHLARTEAWDGTFLDVSGVAPAYSVPSLPWISDPLGALRHLAHMVSASLPDQWAFHEEQAVHAAAATLASLDDVRRGAVYGVRYHEHLARMMSEVTP
jgi:hypothetical protein